MASELDLDAALAIVRRRTPGIWETGGPYPSTSVMVCVDGGSGWPNPEPPMYECVTMIDRSTEGEPHPQAQADAAAIVAAVNNFEAVAERCKRAERNLRDETAIVDRVWKALGIDNYEQAGGKSIDQHVSDLTHQRDELVSALKDIANECPVNNDIRLKVIAALNRAQGGADGKA